MSDFTADSERDDIEKNASAVLFALRTIVIAVVLNLFSPACYGQFRAIAVQQGWFESWALQGKTEAVFRENVESQAQLQIENLKSIVSITVTQEEKLKLALEGDLTRFFRMVDEARFKTRNMQPVNEQVGEISRIISPIQQLVQKGILDETSLFHSVLRSMLTTEQADKWEKEISRRERLINKAILQVQIRALERSMPLLRKQREALITAVLDRIEGKKVIDSYRVYLVDYAMFTVSESKLKEFLDEKQLKFYLERRSQVEGWKSMLEGQGAKFEEEPAKAADEDGSAEGDKKEKKDNEGDDKQEKAPARRNAGGLG